ncbi:MAG: histidine phosphatase family protein [Pirellulales bacterium]|nr:histidine phosphatase family protein [Pirellulales bacterium]
MLLYCIRHGESTYNSEGRIQGQANIPLSPLGRRQSQAVGAALVGLPIEAIYASPLVRAAETADIIGQTIGLAVTVVDDLKEINAGIFQGLKWSEIETAHPTFARKWLDQEPDFVIPSGESRRALMDRGRAALASIRETGHRQVVVVSHGGLLSAGFKALLEIPAERNPFSLYNASINLLAWERQVKLLVVNRIDHLREVNGDRALSSGDL